MVHYRVRWLRQIMRTLYIFIQGCFGVCGGDALTYQLKTSLTHCLFSVWLVFQGAVSQPLVPQLRQFLDCWNLCDVSFINSCVTFVLWLFAIHIYEEAIKDSSEKNCFAPVSISCMYIDILHIYFLLPRDVLSKKFSDPLHSPCATTSVIALAMSTGWTTQLHNILLDMI